MHMNPMKVCISAMLSGFLVAGCSGYHEEVAKAPSPDGRYVAYVVENYGGATTLYGHQVMLVETEGYDALFRDQGNMVAYLDGTVRGERADGAALGLNVQWRDAQTLEISYHSARYLKHHVAKQFVRGETISVLLVEGINDTRPPRGPMWPEAVSPEDR